MINYFGQADSFQIFYDLLIYLLILALLLFGDVSNKLIG